MSLPEIPKTPKIPEMIIALLNSEAYPEPTTKVELIQTHISYVLLTDNFAYKIKKPVNFGFLDFTTLESRLHFCSEELRLNRRLAPDLYLGMVEITERGGTYRIEETGAGSSVPGSSVIDCAVKMKRIAKGCTLEEKINDRSVTPEMISDIGARLANFHYGGKAVSGIAPETETGAETNEAISAYGAPKAIRQNTEQNFTQTEGFVDKIIPEEAYRYLKEYTDTFLTEFDELFMARVTGGFIRDCHGDVHAEHIILPASGKKNTGKETEIEIFDCIEFSERFRFSDTVAEIAFLSMDLDFRGRHDLARILEDSYFGATGDSRGRELINFYKSYRAYIRGKVEGLKFKEPEVAKSDKAEAFFNARHHFHLALRYAACCIASRSANRSSGVKAYHTEQCVEPMLIIVFGLSGTGKSTLAQRLSRLLGAAHISSDNVRKELAGLGASAHSYAGYEKGIYSPEFTKKTYEEIVLRAKETLGAGQACLLDATFLKKSQIDSARSLAGGYPFHIIECSAPEEVILKRLSERVVKESAAGGTLSDAGIETYFQQKKVCETHNTDSIKVDTSLDESETCRKIATEIFSLRQRGSYG